MTRATRGWRAGPAEAAARPGHDARVAALATRLGRAPAEVAACVRAHLQELRTALGPRAHRLAVRAGRALLAAGYERVECDPAEIERLRAVLGRRPAALLASHRSYLDGGALTVALADHDLPPAVQFWGTNLAFWPLGAFFRRSAGVFLRRAADDPVYRLAVREQLGVLLAQRRPLQWFVEGTRSRTGRVGRPRLGLLAWLVEAWCEGGGGTAGDEELVLIPVSVAYERLREVDEYAAEATGARKQPESLGWLLRWLRAQRGGFGTVYVRFGAPLALDAEHAAGGTDLRALALEACRRIERATPLTGTALACVALLGAHGRALAAAQLRIAVQGYVAYAVHAGLALAPGARLADDVDVARVLEGLRRQGIVAVHAAGAEPVYSLVPGREPAAGWYRNTLVHGFVHCALAELALLRAAEAAPGERGSVLFGEAAALRELLQFDFLFEGPQESQAALAAALAWLAPDWRARLGDGGPGATALLETAPTLCAHALLRPFVEAHALVADALAARADGPLEDESLLAGAIALGRQYLLQRRLLHAEAVSMHLCRTALASARARGLCEPGPAASDARERQALELRALLRRTSLVHRIAARRVERALAPAQGRAASQAARSA